VPCITRTVRYECAKPSQHPAATGRAVIAQGVEE
jgi:hypothetical protein